MNRHAKPTAEESLIERAAKVYDFGAHLRGRAVPAYPDAEAQSAGPVAPVPVADVPEPALSEQDAPPTVAARPAAPLSPTLSAIPAEFLSDTDDDGLDEWEAPESDMAQIDRTMLAEAGMLVPGAPVGAGPGVAAARTGRRAGLVRRCRGSRCRGAAAPRSHWPARVVARSSAACCWSASAHLLMVRRSLLFSRMAPG